MCIGFIHVKQNTLFGISDPVCRVFSVVVNVSLLPHFKIEIYGKKTSLVVLFPLQ